MVSMPEEYPWSSYREYLDEAKIVSTAPGLSYFSSLDEFIDFTLSGIEEGLPEVKKVQDYVVYGDVKFKKDAIRTWGLFSYATGLI